ncbi:alginate O-acetyltransferase AlgX-related protein [Prosthecobacter sp.]|uniref:alginate O-acetyltransferase AlgX-related protein n=1 Tax=Prosthecobacter sp. TaxID=1965333 RepID=UPI003783938F
MKPTLQRIDPAKRTILPPEPELSAKAARNIVGVFLFLLAVPLAFEVAARFTPSKTNLAAATVRSGVQWLLLHGLNEGNKAVFVGKDRWLFAQHEIDRLVHARRAGNFMQADLLKLAAELKAQDTPLLVITIPERAALYPEQIHPARYAGVIRLKEEATRLAELKAAGVDVLDMSDAMWETRERPPAYYAQDSHWTPEVMKAVALVVNKHIREKVPRLGNTETPIINATTPEHADAGDLARQLDPRHATTLLGDEVADLVSFQGLEPSAESPIVLFGEELLRVYEDANLSFGGGGAPPHAGFASQLAALMGRPLDVRWRMPARENGYEDKKLVIILLPMAELVP